MEESKRIVLAQQAAVEAVTELENLGDWASEHGNGFGGAQVEESGGVPVVSFGWDWGTFPRGTCGGGDIFNIGFNDTQSDSYAFNEFILREVHLDGHVTPVLVYIEASSGEYNDDECDGRGEVKVFFPDNDTERDTVIGNLRRHAGKQHLAHAIPEPRQVQRLAELYGLLFDLDFNGLAALAEKVHADA